MRVARLLRYAVGPGGPKETGPAQDWRWKVSGLTWKDMKKNYAIIPMFAFTIVAMSMAGGYVLRLATRHPEVAWTKKDSEPWNNYKNKQYKFVDSGRDYSNSSPAPSYKP